jgi:hypothetical protein
MKILRVLEYEGTAEFIANSLKNRSVKVRYEIPDGVIREAILGTFEDLFLQFTKENCDVCNYPHSMCICEGGGI